MKSSDPNSQLPAWIFIATDLALIGAAALIAFTSPRPLPGSAVTWIVTCLGLGAIVGLVPLIVIYERRKNAQLDERQRELEALSRTVSSSAEQISIAANGLHQIAELALKNLRMAEHLPQKLQEKVAEFQAQVAAANDTEKEELERELLSLRTSESERLESTAQRIARSAAEWSKLEAAVQQHFATATTSAAKLGENLSGAIDQARSAAEQALAQARIDAARGVGEASGQAVRNVEAAKAAALAEFDTKLATAAALVLERITAALQARAAAAPTPRPDEPVSVAAAPAPAKEPPTAVATVDSAAPTAPLPADESIPAPATDRGPESAPGPVATAVAAAEAPASVTVSATPASKRPRRPRREETSPLPPLPAPVPAAAPESPAEAKATTPTIPAEEPPPVPVAAIPEITPIAPNTSEPFSEPLAATPSTAVVTPPAEPPPAAARPARRSSERAQVAVEPGLGLDLGEMSSGSVAESMLTSDGATRLLVTAYIGIGNRLFIRGDGPGLSWEKGTPLQFVSIGKWRWDTNDASRPVRFRLFKNDTVECSALGEQAVEPAHQLEVTAAF